MRPTFVLVTGAPASGKTVLAARLARALGWPLMSRDRMKELLWDALAPGDQAAADSATWPLFYALIGELLGHGSNVIAESSVHVQRSVPELQPLLRLALPVHIHLDCARDVRVERYAARVAGRHPCFDAALAERYRLEPDRWVYFEEPPEVGVPVLRLDTSAGEGGVAQALAFIQGARR